MFDLNAVFSAVSGLELSMSKEHHRCKFLIMTFYVWSWHVFARSGLGDGSSLLNFLAKWSKGDLFLFEFIFHCNYLLVILSPWCVCSHFLSFLVFLSSQVWKVCNESYKRICPCSFRKTFICTLKLKSDRLSHKRTSLIWPACLYCTLLQCI